MTQFTFSVDLAVSDIDGYNILFYSNYVKYNQQAAFAILRDLTQDLTTTSDATLQQEIVKKQGRLVQDVRVAKIQAMSFAKQVTWEDRVDIRSTLLDVKVSTSASEGSDEGLYVELRVFQEWWKDGEASASNTSIMSYVFPQELETVVRAKLPVSSTLERRIRAFEKRTAMDNVKASTANDALLLKAMIPSRVDRYVVFPDMYDINWGNLTERSLLDIVERARTNTIGGQATLKALKALHQQNIVVSTIFNLDINRGLQGVNPYQAVLVESYIKLEMKNYYGSVFQRVVIDNEEKQELMRYNILLLLFDSTKKKCIPFEGEVARRISELSIDDQ